MNLCMNSCFAIVLHIILCCINLLPGTQRMLVLASFLMLRRAHCCSIQSTMRSVVFTCVAVPCVEHAHYPVTIFGTPVHHPGRLTIYSANKILKPPAPSWYSRSSMLCGFGQYMLPQMLPWFRLTGSLVAAILVLQIRDFLASFLPSDE